MKRIVSFLLAFVMILAIMPTINISAATPGTVKPWFELNDEYGSHYSFVVKNDGSLWIVDYRFDKQSVSAEKVGDDFLWFYQDTSVSDHYYGLKTDNTLWEFVRKGRMRRDGFNKNKIMDNVKHVVVTDDVAMAMAFYVIKQMEAYGRGVKGLLKCPVQEGLFMMMAIRKSLIAKR